MLVYRVAGFASTNPHPGKTLETRALLQIADDARRNRRVAEQILGYAIRAFVHLGWSEDAARDYARNMLLGANYGPDDENILRSAMPMPAMTNLAARMVERADMTYSKIAPHIIEGSVLDLGGGSGEIGKRIARDGHSVYIADVRDWRRDTSLGFIPVTNNRIGVLDESYDNVVVLHVFHHSEDPEALLKDAFRVARRRVIFLETVANDLEQFLYDCWMDWFYNRIIHYAERPKDKIPVPCRFLPTAGWEQMVWRLYGLEPVASVDLGIYQFLNPIHHHLFVYDK